MNMWILWEHHRVGMALGCTIKHIPARQSETILKNQYEYFRHDSSGVRSKCKQGLLSGV
jgi:hypothetical protein